MKFHLLCVLTLCVCLGQICAGSDEWISGVEKLIRDAIYGVGDQFVDDFIRIVERNRNNSFITESLGKTISMLIPKEKNSTMDVNQVRNLFSKSSGSSDRNEAMRYESLKIFLQILSGQFPPERYNGVVNVIFVCAFDFATTDEIQSALNFVYGIDTEATKTSFPDAHDIPNPTREDCPSQHQWYSSTINDLRRLIGVSPKVMQDSLAIREKFPCNELTRRTLERFVYIIQRLGGDKSKINACMIKESPGYWDKHWHSLYNSKVYMEYELEGSESILSTRLPDETIRGIINFKRATIPDTPIDEIEKALEYLYEDVTKIDCPATEISTLKAE